MKRTWMNGLIVIGSVVMLGAGIQAAQRGWVMPGKSAGQSMVSRTRPLTVGPLADTGSSANGIYCTSPSENGVGINHLGAIPAGFHLTVTIESFSANFNPVAAVVVATVGEKAGNNVKIATYYDNDSGGDNDARVDFVTPQAGDYILLVGDYTDKTAGCYRYEVSLR